MDNLPKVLVELEAQYRDRRPEFLEAAFKISWVGLSWSAAQFDLGQVETAAGELRNVESACETLWKFVSQIENERVRRGFESDLLRIQKGVKVLRTEIGTVVSPH
jgi:hypothetical protein